MEIVYLLIPLSLVLVGGIVWAFFWAVRSGQFDDLEGPAYQILMDDDDPPGRRAAREKREAAEKKEEEEVNSEE
jgi:cbb3-type cytochrome oxidase maturation protein